MFSKAVRGGGGGGGGGGGEGIMHVIIIHTIHGYMYMHLPHAYLCCSFQELPVTLQSHWHHIPHHLGITTVHEVERYVAAVYIMGKDFATSYYFLNCIFQTTAYNSQRTS